MSIRHCVAVATLAVVVFGSASRLVLAGDESRSGTTTETGPGNVVMAQQLAGMPRQAPIGHRQPRAADVPGGDTRSSFDLEQQRQDETLDRRLIICRGC